jgi:hypothetical protein
MLHSSHITNAGAEEDKVRGVRRSRRCPIDTCEVRARRSAKYPVERSVVTASYRLVRTRMAVAWPSGLVPDLRPA